MIENWAVIINPVAGGRKGEKDWPAISSALVKNNISFDFFFTEREKHAVELTISLINKGYSKFIAVGGDGTLNEVANGILIQNDFNSIDIILSQIATGTGNDWQKTYEISDNYIEAAKRIAECRTVLQDAGEVIYNNMECQTDKKYFINVAGLGFDAIVTRKANLLRGKRKSGKLVYLLTLLKSLIKSNYYKCKIEINNELFLEEMFNLTVGIGKYNGGGMKFCPNAVTDDGLFDVTLVNKISKTDVLLNVRNIYKGTFINHPSVKLLKSSSLKIESDIPAGIETDGEFIGFTPAEFKIIPSCLRVVV